MVPLYILAGAAVGVATSGVGVPCGAWEALTLLVTRRRTITLSPSLRGAPSFSIVSSLARCAAGVAVRIAAHAWAILWLVSGGFSGKYIASAATITPSASAVSTMATPIVAGLGRHRRLVRLTLPALRLEISTTLHSVGVRNTDLPRTLRTSRTMLDAEK